VLWLVWAGKYKSSTGSAECTPCDAGKYGTTRAAVSDCTACQAGTYQAETSATSCMACPWYWESKEWGTMTDSIGKTDPDACVCKTGATGSGVGLAQDTPSKRPVYNESGGRLGTGGISFNRTGLSFLHGRDKAIDIATHGGLTIVAEVKFSGTVGKHERIVDLGSTLERHYDSIVLSRWDSSDKIYAAITNKVKEIESAVSLLHCFCAPRWAHCLLDAVSATEDALSTKPLPGRRRMPATSSVNQELLFRKSG